MATHSNILAWKIPSTEEPGGLLCTGLQRVGRDGAQPWTAGPCVYFAQLLKISLLSMRNLFRVLGDGVNGC